MKSNRRVIAYKVTKEKFKKAIEGIGWKMHEYSIFGPLYNAKGENVGWQTVGSERLEQTSQHNFTMSVVFYWRDCILEKLDFETICLRSKTSKDIFILFHNFDLGKEK